MLAFYDDQHIWFDKLWLNSKQITSEWCNDSALKTNYILKMLKDTKFQSHISFQATLPA